ncbi:MAG: LamG-like jellyroll fold domain-containing protein [Lacibacter sp.]
MIRLLFLLLLTSETLFAQVNLNQGLMAHYPFNGNANDVSGNNNNPVFNNATLTADRVNNPNSAYKFNGINNYIQIPNSPTLNMSSSITLAAFVKTTGFYYGTCHGNAILMKGLDAAPTTTFRLRFGDEMYSNGTNCTYSPPDTIHQNYWGHGAGAAGGYTPYVTKNEWVSVIYTYDGTYAKLYINCQLVLNNFSPGYNFSNTHDLFLGKMDDPTFPYWFNGEMDDVRIYNRAINEDEVKAIVGSCQNTALCDNWLFNPSFVSAANIGDLDISGDKITVEALINRTTPWSGGTLLAGDVVSKHSNTTDANYLLRPNSAQITTTNGHFLTPEICDIELNKTYHIAMVYDGQALKFYRNGFLMSQVAVTGNLILNDWNTRIGLYEFQGGNTNFIGYINEVRIWNVAKTQSQLQTYLNTSLPSPTTQTGLQAYYTFDNLLNKQGNAAWNATLNGASSINATNTSCSFVADSCRVLTCTVKNDFSFSRNPCSPNTISFSTTSTTYNSISWDFGDTNTATGSSTAVHTYATAGNYQVVMIQDYGTCIDTVKKTITVDIQNDNQTILTNDTTICFGKTKQLLSSPALSYCWSPTTFLNNPSAQNPISSTTQSIIYYLTTESNGTNLITNGNFSNGNTGFTSSYNYASSNITEGQYFVGASPQIWNSSLSNCGDHSTGNGNMMLVNGTPAPDIKVWTQTVTVVPNTNYSFSTWIQALWPPNPAQLQFSINGNDIGNLITASLPTCSWTQFYSTWNSGNNSSAVISIINKNTQIQGNDFALDDITFSPVYIKRDSIKITVDTPSINTNPDLVVCEGTQTQLATTGASTYTWSPATGLSNPNISNPIATPASTTQYFVAGTNSFGCISKDSVTITVHPKPVITITNDTVLCNNATLQLLATGGTSYTWSPAATLDNNLIPNPVASPSSNTKYYVTVKDANNCSNTDSVQVNIRSVNNFIISPPADICKNDSIQLSASGGDTYSWNNAPTLNNASISNPFASPQTTTSYSVLITDTVCHNSTTLSTTVTVLPLPVLSLTKSNDIDCSINQSQLTASGATIYSWLPAGTLNNPAVYNPVASPTATTNYTVTGTDLDGCMNTDSITVLVNADNKGGYLMPNAFTPNNDGVNDCYGTKYWGIILEIEFSIFNRWGERVFYTTDPAKCWDGTYKGIQQNPDVFSYMIKAKTSCESYVFRNGTFTLIR